MRQPHPHLRSALSRVASLKGQPPDNAPVEAYRLFQQRIGTSRVVIVNPSTYGTDNRATLDAAARMGAAARAVVVVDLDITDRQLKEMAAQGAVSIRVNFVSPQSWGVTTAEQLETMAKRVSELGWHVQIYATGDQIVELESVLARLPTRIVIDHLGRLPQPAGVGHPAHRTIRTLLDQGRTWLSFGRLPEHRAWPARLCRCDQGGPSLRAGGAGENGLGERLATSGRKGDARRCHAVRPPKRMGAERNRASPHPG